MVFRFRSKAVLLRVNARNRFILLQNRNHRGATMKPKPTDTRPRSTAVLLGILALIVVVAVFLSFTQPIPDQLPAQLVNRHAPTGTVLPPIAPLTLRPKAGTDSGWHRFAMEEVEKRRIVPRYLSPAPTSEDQDRIHRLLTFTGSSTRSEFFHFAEDCDALISDWVDTPEHRRHLDILLSALDIPYYGGISPALDFDPSCGTQKRVNTLGIAFPRGHSEQVRNTIAWADEMGVLPLYIEQRPPPFSHLPQLPSQTDAELKQEHETSHLDFVFSKDRIRLQALLARGETPPPGWRLPTAAEEMAWKSRTEQPWQSSQTRNPLTIQPRETPELSVWPRKSH